MLLGSQARFHRLPLVGLVYAALAVLLILPAGGRAVGQERPSGRFQKTYALEHAAVGDIEPLLVKLLPDGGATSQLVVDSRANQLHLTGPPEAHNIARQLIAQLDRPRATPTRSESTLKRYHPGPGEMTSTAAWLRSRFPPTADVRVTADGRSGQLLVVAPPEIHDQIPELLAMRAANLPTSANRRPLRATDSLNVRFEHTRCEQIELQLREMLRQRLRPVEQSVVEYPVYVFTTDVNQRVQLRFDRQQNQATIEGPAHLVEQFGKLFQSLDRTPGPAGKVERIVPLRYSDLSKVRKAVDAFQGRASPIESPRANQRPGTPASLDGAESSAIDRAVTQPAGFHTDPRQGGVRFALALFQPGGQPPPVENQPVFREPDEERERQRERLEALGADVEVESLPELDVIILRGDERDVEELVRIIEEIERISAETEPAIEIYQLRHANSEAIAQIINQVQVELLSGRQGRVIVTALVKPNAVLLIGWGEAIAAVTELVRKLDQPVGPETQLRVFRLRHAAANQAEQTVEQFFQNRPGMGPKVIATADERTNSLIVQAAPRDMVEVELLIGRLDAARGEAVNELRTFRLRNSLAADVGPVLQQAIQGATGPQTGAGGRSNTLQFLTIDAEGRQLLKSGILGDVQVTPDPRTNTLLVSAPSESMELLAALIRQLDDLPATVAQIKVFKIVNGDASNLVEMLRSLLGTPTAAGEQLAGAEGEPSLAQLRFSVDSRTNTIIASGAAGDLNIVEAILLRLDEDDVQHRKNEVYRLKNSPALDVARAVNDFLRSERQVQQAAPGSISPFRQIETEVVVVPEIISNTLIISATPRFYEEIRDLVEQLDAQPPQVMIQVLIAEVALNSTDEFGVELGVQDSVLFDRSLLSNLITTTNSTQTSTPAGIVTDTQQIIQAANNDPGFVFNNFPLGNSASGRALNESDRVGSQALSHFGVGRMNGELGFGGLVLSASSESVSMLIRALSERRRVDVLSRPQVMTLDNQPAFIQVGQRVPRITGVTVNQTGQLNQIELENVGLILGVTPRISPEGMVVMEIDVEKSDLGPIQDGIPVSIASTGEVIRSPLINTTTAQTTVSAANGQTIVLGGLITKSKATVDRRVPLLSSIPILGNLFRYDAVMGKKTELLVILTPRVVSNEEDAELIKQTESARISWCLADVQKMHGDAGLCRRGECPHCDAGTPVVYPDLDPHGVIENNEWEMQIEPVPGEMEEVYPPGPILPAPESRNIELEPTVPPGQVHFIPTAPAGAAMNGRPANPMLAPAAARMPLVQGAPVRLPPTTAQIPMGVIRR